MIKRSFIFMVLSACSFFSITADATSITEPYIDLRCSFKQPQTILDRCGANQNCSFQIARKTGCATCGFDSIKDAPEGYDNPYMIWLTILKDDAPNNGAWKALLRFNVLRKPPYTDAEMGTLADAVTQFCAEGGRELKAVLPKMVKRWGDVYKTGALIIEPYQDGILEKKERRVDSHTVCKYEAMERFGGWLAVYKHKCSISAGGS